MLGPARPYWGRPRKRHRPSEFDLGDLKELFLTNPGGFTAGAIDAAVQQIPSWGWGLTAGGSAVAIGRFGAQRMTDFFRGKKRKVEHGSEQKEEKEEKTENRPVPRVIRQNRGNRKQMPRKRRRGYRRRRGRTARRRYPKGRRMAKTRTTAGRIMRAITSRATKAAVRKIKKMANTSEVQRYMVTSGEKIATSINIAGPGHFDGLSETDVASIINETLPTIDGGVVTYKDLDDTLNTSTIIGLGGYEKYTFKNNYNYAVTVECMCYKARQNTNSTVQTYINETWGRRVTNAAKSLLTSPEAEPAFSLKRLSAVVRPVWKPCFYKKRYLKPTEGFIWWFPIGKGRYSLEKDNVDSLEYRAGISYNTCVRIIGEVCHDKTDNSLVGWSDSACDFVRTREWRFIVKHENQIKRIEYIDNLDAVVQAEAMEEDAQEVDAVVGEQDA